MIGMECNYVIRVLTREVTLECITMTMATCADLQTLLQEMAKALGIYELKSEQREAITPT